MLVLAELHDHDPWGYLKDVLICPTTQLNSRMYVLLTHIRQPARESTRQASIPSFE